MTDDEAREVRDIVLATLSEVLQWSREAFEVQSENGHRHMTEESWPGLDERGARIKKLGYTKLHDTTHVLHVNFPSAEVGRTIRFPIGWPIHVGTQLMADDSVRFEVAEITYDDRHGWSVATLKPVK